MNNYSDLIQPSVLGPVIHDIISAVYALLASTGFLLNSLVLLVFFLDRSLLTAPNMFIVSIAVADLLMAVVANPLGAVANSLQAWPFGRSSCIFYAWLTSFLGLSTMLHHSALAIERCQAVVLSSKGQSSHRRTLCGICVMWSFTLIWSLCPLLGWSAYDPEGSNTVCSIRWISPRPVDTSFVICIFILFFFAPLVVITTCYVIVYYKATHLLQKKSVHRKHKAKANAIGKTVTKSVPLAKVAALMVVGFLTAWTPYAAVSMYTAFTKAHVPALVTVVPAIFAKSAILYNPLIHFFLYKRFRRSLRKLWSAFVSRNTVFHDTRLEGNIALQNNIVYHP